MGRIFKVLGIVVGALVVLLIVVVIAVGMLFDPNEYKDEITAAVGDATGRTLTLEGDLELKLFPRIGIRLGAAELSNASGFGNEAFARIEGAELNLGLLPLLSRRVEVDSASLAGLRLNLARNGTGGTNWDDLARGDGAEPTAADVPEGSDAGGSVDISVGAIEISDAEVTWRDATTGQDWRLSDFNLSASGFDPGRAFPLEIGFALAGAEVAVEVQAGMRAQVALAEQTYSLSDLNVELAGEGAGWPGGAGEASLSFTNFVANLGDQSLVLDGLELEILGLTVRGNLDGRDLLDGLALEGDIEIDDFDPRFVMNVFDTAIETADPGVLKRASASAEFYFNEAAMGMREMALRLDDSELTGSAGMRGDRFEFDLVVDTINIDRYLPPPAEGEEELPADTGSVDEIDLPLDPLRNFNANGNLALNSTQFLGMTFTEANFALTAGNGRMTLTPTGRLYGGTLDGEITVAVQGDSGRLSLDAALAGVDMAGIGRDYLKIDSLAGTGSVNLALAATGAKVGEIKRGLDGTAAVAINDGAWLGIDIWQEIMEGRAALTGPDAPAPQDEARTAFNRIAVGGPVENAVMTTSEFTAALPWAVLNGSGTIDLLTLALDLRAQAGLVDGPALQQDPVLAEYAGRQIPLTIGGTVSAPRILPDVSGMLSQAVQQRVDEEVDEAQQRVDEEVDEAVDEARDNAEESIRDRLRDALD